MTIRHGDKGDSYRHGWTKLEHCPYLSTKRVKLPSLDFMPKVHGGIIAFTYFPLKAVCEKPSRDLLNWAFQVRWAGISEKSRSHIEITQRHS
jgi:hypothetical protein